MSGQTIAEKVMSRQNLAGVPVTAGDLIAARVDGLMVHSFHWAAIRAGYKRLGFEDGPPKVWDPERLYLMLEHQQPPRDHDTARHNASTREEAARLGLKHFYDSEMGICHQMMADYGLLRPGEFVVGTDSHTLAYGALNVLSSGIATDEAAYVVAFGELYFTVPETIKVTLNGSARDYPFGKDIMLYLAGQYGNDFAAGKSIEFHGPMAEAMSLADRTCIADQGDEVGAKFAVFLADDKTRDYVRARTSVPFEPVVPDADARYEREIVVDCDALEFQVAKPYRFDNVVPVSEVAGTKIEEARIGTCANGRFEDLEIAAKLLAGRHVAPGVRFYVSPASQGVYRQCVDSGVLTTLLDAGVQVLPPGCGICGQIMLNDQVGIAAVPRNSHARFGGPESSDAQMYLAGPATVAASALAGEIVDPREVLRA
jgi:3-isopropylmalate/(R)-2-methylmalate dehydratase large subunit